MKRVIKIGTRDSQLALWQAQLVKDQLALKGFESELIPVKAEGDLKLDQPLYELGITGIFTKTLDVAMLNGKIDIAVHSLKDVPTLLPSGIVQTAVLERASSSDVLLFNKKPNFKEVCTIATGSLRRKAQWLHRYPHHKVVGLRGNVNTRLKKLVDSDWNGAIFAKAGLERVSLLPEEYEDLSWMVPAPAQGAMVVVTNHKDDYCIEATKMLNHIESEVCTTVEREFLKVLEGGCTAPIGAIASITDQTLKFRGNLLSIDGKQELAIEKSVLLENSKGFGAKCAQELLSSGGRELMEEIRNA